MTGGKRSNDGPGTRLREKRQKLGDSNSPSSILRRISSSDDIQASDAHRLYRIDRPVCQGCRINTKDNPNCFCGLIPAAGGFRKQGLWQKNPQALQALGPDPAGNLRPGVSPIGLYNLGATCYVNSILQCLYMIPAFRCGIFRVEEGLCNGNDVLKQLTLLFAELQAINRDAVNPADLANTLQLNSSIQQDGHEFMKLLLTLLERLLQDSKFAEVNNLVQSLFRGSSSYATVCSSCRQSSESSSRSVDFYELELNVKGFPGVVESLQDLLAEESLEGENQYHCNSCGKRTNAVRRLRLHRLPPVLDFQLKRFVYDVQTGSKRKVSSRFSFPLSMGAGPFCNRPSTSTDPYIYDLSAILVHKGSLASSGHYITHIREESSGLWYKFDDENVVCLGAHPLGVSTSSDDRDSKVREVEDGRSKKKRRNKVKGGRSDDSEEGSEDEVSESVPVQDPNILTSADAYMLLYTRRGVEKSAQPDGDTSMKSVSLLPSYLQSYIDQENRGVKERVEKYRREREEKVQEVDGRRKTILSFLAVAPVLNVAEECCFVSNAWLRSWADDEKEPGLVDNKGLLCEHARFPPASAPLSKRISTQAWDMCFETCGGGPKITFADICYDCIRSEAKAAVSADSFRDRRGVMREKLEEGMGEGMPEGNLYFVSKHWLSAWQRRRNVDHPSEPDLHPTSDLECSHGDLLPERAVGAKRQVVSEELWEYFASVSDDLSVQENRTPVFPVTCTDCAICAVEYDTQASRHEGQRATKLDQQQRHQSLFSSRPLPLCPFFRHYLLPSPWLMQWRAFLSSTTPKAIEAAEPPPSLAEAMLACLCEKHNLLSKPLPLLIRRKNEIVQNIKADFFSIVSPEDWEGLCVEWKADSSAGIKAFLMVEESKGEEESFPLLVTDPKVCEECLEEQASLDFASKLQYSDEEITVRLEKGTEPSAIIESAHRAPPGTDRRSRRNRQAAAHAGGRVALSVSGESTIKTLKMQIWESLNVILENQRLGMGGREFTDDCKRLADENVFPGSVLWVVDTKEHGNRDIAEEFEMEENETLGRAEEGFRGTSLLGLGNGHGIA